MCKNKILKIETIKYKLNIIKHRKKNLQKKKSITFIKQVDRGVNFIG